MENDGDIAAPKPSEPHATTIEGDGRRAVDRKPHSTPVELADSETRRLNPDDDAAVHRLPGCRARRREDEGAEKQQPEPSHARILADLRQNGVCSV